MKKIAMILIFISLLSLPAFAFVDGGLRLDLGFNGMYYIFSDEMREDLDWEGFSPHGFFIPFFDFGLYGQLNLGPLHVGTGFRGLSFFGFANAFWPAVYAELELWKFSLTAQVGGYAFMTATPIPLVFADDYLVPDLSLWFKPNRYFNLGFGAMTLLSQEDVNRDYFRDFHEHVMFYGAMKFTIPTAGFKKQKERWRREAVYQGLEKRRQTMRGEAEIREREAAREQERLELLRQEQEAAENDERARRLVEDEMNEILE